MLFLIAQAVGGDVGQLGSASGWVSTGLLGSVLSWLLLVYLPAKDKQVQGLIDQKDKGMSEAISSFRDEAKLIRDSHDRIVSRQQDLDQSTNKELAGMLAENTTQTRMLAASVGNLAERIGVTVAGPHKA